jgi:hypothetical protein
MSRNPSTTGISAPERLVENFPIRLERCRITLGLEQHIWLEEAALTHEKRRWDYR